MLRPLQSPAALLPELLFPLWPFMARPAAALGRSRLQPALVCSEQTLASILSLRLWGACVWLMSVPQGPAWAGLGVVSQGDVSGAGVLVLTCPRPHRAQGPSESLCVLL